MNTSLNPVVPPPTERPALDLPLIPRWALRPATEYRCQKVGCACVFRGCELINRERWSGDRYWFAPCGHEQTTQRPRPQEVTP